MHRFLVYYNISPIITCISNSIFFQIQKGISNTKNISKTKKYFKYTKKKGFEIQNNCVYIKKYFTNA